MKIVITHLNGHDACLNIKEAIDASTKAVLHQANLKSKTYDYSYVSSSTRTLNDYKQMETPQAKLKSVWVLYKKNSSLKVTINFDIIARSSIDGELPILILFFSDGQEFWLIPLFFAYEDRQQIFLSNLMYIIEHLWTNLGYISDELFFGACLHYASICIVWIMSPLNHNSMKLKNILSFNTYIM